MIPAEIARQVRAIEIIGKRAAAGFLAGEYGSVFKGRGMEFDEVREYQPGDEVRSIDWNVTARTGVPHVKRYVEERDLTVVFMVDVSASMAFGSAGKLKSRAAAELVTLLAFAAARNNDRAGLLLFADDVERFVPPRKGSGHVSRLVREVLAARPHGGGTGIGAALRYLGRVVQKQAVVFLVSDFLCRPDDYARPLAVAARRHDVIALGVADRRESALPPLGLMELRDAETGERRLVDCAAASRAMEEGARRRRERLGGLFARAGVDHVPIVLDEGVDTDAFVRELAAFFRRRERRR